jgi:hypothetical protein
VEGGDPPYQRMGTDMGGSVKPRGRNRWESHHVTREEGGGSEGRRRGTVL